MNVITSDKSPRVTNGTKLPESSSSTVREDTSGVENSAVSDGLIILTQARKSKQLSIKGLVAAC
jgi:hypothetical protein